MTSRSTLSDLEIERAVRDGEDALARANLMVRNSRAFLLAMRAPGGAPVQAEGSPPPSAQSSSAIDQPR